MTVSLSLFTITWLVIDFDIPIPHFMTYLDNFFTRKLFDLFYPGIINLPFIPWSQRIAASIIVYKYLVPINFIYHYKVIKNCELTLFEQNDVRAQRVDQLWYVLVILGLLSVFEFVTGFRAVKYECFIFALAYTWYRDRPLAPTDMLFLFYVTSNFILIQDKLMFS